MISARLFIALFLVVPMSSLVCSPISDLSSPSQETRDAAARVLRTTYRMPSPAAWNPLMATIKLAETTRKELLENLDHFGVSPTSDVGTGREFSSFCLDDRWTLTCWFQPSRGTKEGDTLTRCRLSEQVRWVWVDPPANFTGVWITYFVNGQPSSEIEYKDGRYFGVFTGFHPTGAKRIVQHYGPLGCDGADTHYFPSGRVESRGYYQDGVPKGTKTWYNEDGSVRTTEEFPRPPSQKKYLQ